MKIQKAIVILFCVMVIAIPFLTPMLRLDKIPGLGWMALYRFSNESALFGWVKLYYFAAAIVTLWAVSLLMPGEKSIRFNLADVFIGTFLFLGFINMLADPHRFDSSRRLGELLASFSLYLVAKNVITTKQYKKWLLYCIVISIGIVSALGVIHYAISFDERLAQGFIIPPIGPMNVPWEADFGTRATSLIGNPNFLADILILTIPLFIGGLVFLRKDGQAALMAFVLVITLALLLFTNSWGGYIGSMVSIAAMIVLLLWKRPEIKYKGLLAGAIVACLVITSMFVWYKRGEILGRKPVAVKAAVSTITGAKEEESEEEGVEELVGVRSRRILWESAGDMIRNRPVRGWGLGNFFTYSNIFLSKFSTDPYYEKLWAKRPAFVLRNPGRVHNEYLSLAVELGIPGLLLFMSFFGLLIYESLKGWKPGNVRVQDAIIFGTVCGIVAILVQSAVSFPFRLPISMMFICTLLGLAVEGKPWRTLRFNGLPRPYWIAASIPVFVVALLVAWRASVIAVCLTKFQHAIERYENYGNAYLKLPRYADQQVIDDLKFATAHWHKDHDVYFRLPFYLIARNRLDEAAEAMKKLEYVQPYHEKTFFYWAEIYRKQGNYVEAVKAYKQAIKYEARYIVARALLVDTYIKMGRIDEAQKEIDEALVYEKEAQDRLEEKQKEARELQEEKDKRRLELLHQKIDPKVMADIEEKMSVTLESPTQQAAYIVDRLSGLGDRIPGDLKDIENQIKTEFFGRNVGLQLEDVVFYWLHNSQAIIYATEQDFDSAIEEFRAAQRSYATYGGIQDVPIYTYHANFDVFGHNIAVAQELINQKKPEDITEWTNRFYSASDLGNYDLIEKKYENAYLSMRYAYLGVPEYRDVKAKKYMERSFKRFLNGKTKEEKALEEANEALEALDEMRNQFSTTFLGADGIVSRLPDFRAGVLYISMDPPNMRKAREAFKKALEITGDQNLVNYNLLWGSFKEKGVAERNLGRLMDVDSEYVLRAKESQIGRMARYPGADPETVEDYYDRLRRDFQFYAPVYLESAAYCMKHGNTDRAKAIITDALKIFPTHPEVLGLAGELGIPLPPGTGPDGN